MSRYYVHKFEVIMVVEDVSAPKKAERWLDARLGGGDAHFYSTHKSAEAMTAAESEDYNERAELPKRFESR